jgi:hypothetical protein
MVYQYLGTPSESAVTNHNTLCLVLNSNSAQLPVLDWMSKSYYVQLTIMYENLMVKHV